ncbi:hypothetical protein [Haloechinothrix halophila]|uniref:hypothetical protein n=1 Tax=Haloechinothrix halophila TaxID=1069073 RepID=UPI000408F394|nr:hypothetical protein [Haloechinothrix halophila]
MTDGHGSPLSDDADFERTLSIRDALYALWNPGGQPITVTWTDSNIITADDQTRSRLTQAHAVIHAVLQNEPGDAMARLTAMTSLMAAFTALRSLTLASETLWNSGISIWSDVLADAREALPEMVAHLPADDGRQARTGADTLHNTIRANLLGEQHERILDCVARVAHHQAKPFRVGLGMFGAEVLVSALRRTSGRSAPELREEHAALLAALSGVTVTHRDGRLIVDG